jgi:multiple sugar transport system permease protein
MSDATTVTTRPRTSFPRREDVRATRRPAQTAKSWARSLILLLAVVVVVYPILFLLITSMRPQADLINGGFLPSTVTFEHYRTVFAGEGAGYILLNSLMVASTTTVISVAVGTLAAYALSRLQLPAGVVTAVIFCFIFVRFYPRIATVVPWFLVTREFGLLDTVWAVVLGHLGITIPFVTWLMFVMFKDMPPALEEAAALDGASIWQRFWHVAVPVSTPGMVSAAIFTAFLSWNEYLIASSVTRDVAKVLPTAVAGYVTDKGINWGPMSAMSVLVVIPMLLFAFTVQRYLVKGLTLGAVKG